ncbi:MULTISPECIES: hypothetical protein [Clostridium]|uniref:hypothetical protein n=1 Tax=Clostridium TaxID=1485 RepID=UPI000BE408A2|nr:MULTISPECIES: hypothetical protein [Clostridium]MBS4958690.1 hypothetical protein [Clostridium sp.]
MKHLTNFDLCKNELQNARVQNLGTPPENPVPGQIYYNSSDNVFYGWNGANWINLAYNYNGETFTNDEKTKLGGIAENATKTEKSTTNGNIKINGAEVNVYNHPSGTNPHNTTKSDIGLGNVENKSSSTIRGELTTADINKALGFTPKNILEGLESARPAATGSLRVYIATDTKKIFYDQGTNNWLQIGGQDTIAWNNVTNKPSTFTPPTASSTVLGGIKVGTNLTIGADGTLNANDNPTSYLVKQEKFIATEGQKLFNLIKGSYRQGLGALSIFVFGSKLANEAFAETSTTSFTLKTGLSEGDIVLVEYIQLINVQPYPIHANEHLSDGADPIPLATTSKEGLMAASDKSKIDNSYTKTQVDAAISAAVNGLINGAPGALDTLIELASALGNDPNFAATITNSLATKVDKITGKGLSTNDFTDILLNKLNGIATGANNYTHPSSHPGSMITEDSTHRFATDAEKSAWNAKAGTATATVSANGLMSNLDKSKLDGIEANANNYVHPNDANIRHVTDSEKVSWNSRTRKYAANIGNGTATTITVTHNLNTTDITVTLREVATPYNVVITDIQIVDANNIKLLFAVAPTANQYRVVVIG